MEPIESSETSAYNNNTLTPETYPKEKKLQSKHGENLKSRIDHFNQTISFDGSSHCCPPMHTSALIDFSLNQQHGGWLRLKSMSALVCIGGQQCDEPPNEIV